MSGVPQRRAGGAKERELAYDEIVGLAMVRGSVYDTATEEFAMDISNDDLQYALEPLKVVDVKTLSSIAENLKRSRDKKKKAVGVFLARLNRCRLEQPAAGKKPPAPSTVIDDSSGLKDLRD